MQQIKTSQDINPMRGLTGRLRKLAAGKFIWLNPSKINRGSLEATKSKLKNEEGIILKSKTIQGRLRVKRMF